MPKSGTDVASSPCIGALNSCIASITEMRNEREHIIAQMTNSVQGGEIVAALMAVHKGDSTKDATFTHLLASVRAFDGQVAQ